MEVTRRHFCSSLAAFALLPVSEEPLYDVNVLVSRGTRIQVIEAGVTAMDLLAQVRNGGKRDLSINLSVKSTEFDVDQFVRPYGKIALESPISRTYMVGGFVSIYACIHNGFSIGMREVEFHSGDHRHLRYMMHRFENHGDRVRFSERMLHTDPILGAYLWDRSHPLLAGESEYFERK